MAKHSNVWADRDVSTKTKNKLVQTLIFPITNYEAETWTLTAAKTKKIHVFELWCWRRPWTKRATNASVLQTVGRPAPLEGIVAKLRLNYFGHVIKSNGFEKTALHGND